MKYYCKVVVLYTTSNYVKRIISSILLLFTLTSLFGCSKYVDRPMSSSLTELTSESSSTNTKLLNYSELLSVAGLLPMPDVGVLYYQPETFWWDDLFGNDVGAFKSVGIARNPAERNSFRIIGEMTDVPKHQEVIDAVKRINDLSEASAEGVNNLIKQSAIKLQLVKAHEERIKVGDPNYSPDEYSLIDWGDWDKQKLSVETKIKLLDAIISNLSADKTNIDKAVVDDEKNINDLKEAAQVATSIPGLIIAKWSTQSSEGAGASVGNSYDSDGFEEESEVTNAVSIAASASKGQSGLAVLGGLKVASLFVAEDYMKMLASTESDGYRALLNEVGVTTSVMQTRYVSYSSNVNIASSINVKAQIEASSLYGISSKSILQGMDTAKLSAYLNNASNLSNKGNIGGMNWTRDEIDYYKCAKNSDTINDDCEFSTMDRYTPYNNRFPLHDAKQIAKPEKQKVQKQSEYNGWITLQSIQARLDSRVLDALLPVYQKEKDLEECEFCLDQESIDKCLDDVRIKYSSNSETDEY